MSDLVAKECRKCGSEVYKKHCSSPTCPWCERCGNAVHNEVFEKIVNGEWEQRND